MLFRPIIYDYKMQPEFNPDAGPGHHVITWQPGQHGRYIVDGNGHTHAWNVNPGDPMMMDHYGYMASVFHNKGWDLLQGNQGMGYINPKGQPQGGGEALAAQALGTQQGDSSEWHFGALRVDEYPNIEHGARPWTEGFGGTKNLRYNSYPVIHYLDENGDSVLGVGRFNGHHHPLMEAMGLTGDDNYTLGFMNPDKGMHEFWGPVPAHVTQHFIDQGMPPKEGWHFSSAEDGEGYDWPYSEPYAKLHFPTDWERSWNEQLERPNRVPFIYTVHEHDPNEVHVYLGHPGMEHAGILEPGGPEWSNVRGEYIDYPALHPYAIPRLWPDGPESIGGYGSVKPLSYQTGNDADKERHIEFYTQPDPRPTKAVADALTAHAPFALPPHSFKPGELYNPHNDDDPYAGEYFFEGSFPKREFLPAELQNALEARNKAITLNDGTTHVFDGDDYSHLKYLDQVLHSTPDDVQHYWIFDPWQQKWENLNRFKHDYQNIYNEVGPAGQWDFGTVSKEAAAPLYHVAWAEDVPTIEQHGLEPADPGAGYTDETPQPAGVYLWNSLPEAQQFAASRELPTAIFEINPEGLTLLPDPMMPTGASYSADPIPAQSLRRIAKPNYNIPIPQRINDYKSPTEPVGPQDIQPWAPGSYGKFIGFPDGYVKAWRNDPNPNQPDDEVVEERDGWPSHAGVAEALGRPLDYGEEDGFELPHHTLGYISPNGEIDPGFKVHERTPQHIQSLHAQYPGQLSEQTPGEWHFAADDSWLPPTLYHWTEARNAPKWWANGSPSAGVYLTTASDPQDDWNPDVPHLLHPLRITIDTSKLDSKAFGATDGEGYSGPPERTLAISGNVYYTGRIPREAVEDMQRFKAPDDWEMELADPINFGYAA